MARSVLSKLSGGIATQAIRAHSCGTRVAYQGRPRRLNLPSRAARSGALLSHAHSGPTTPAGIALYIGALLGPSLLLVPGLAAAIAGPASHRRLGGAAGLSGLLAWVFMVLGRTMPRRGGVAGYARAGLGAGRRRRRRVVFPGRRRARRAGRLPDRRGLRGRTDRRRPDGDGCAGRGAAGRRGRHDPAGARCASAAQLALVACCRARCGRAVVGAAPQAAAEQLDAVRAAGLRRRSGRRRRC